MKKIIILILALVISACSSNVKKDHNVIAAESYNKGKAAYLAGDYSLAIGLLIKAASKGNADAQYAVGYMVYYGEGAEPNTDEAIGWIRKAAESGNSKAYLALAMIQKEKRKKPSSNKQD